MIFLKNFEIRTVIYENDLVAKGTCHSQSSQIFPAQDSVQSFAIRLQHDIFHHKGHKTHKIRKSHKTKEIILWFSHLTADLRHIYNKNLKKKHYLENVWNHDTCNHLITSAETSKGLLNTQTSAVQTSFE